MLTALRDHLAELPGGARRPAELLVGLVEEEADGVQVGGEPGLAEEHRVGK